MVAVRNRKIAETPEPDNEKREQKKEKLEQIPERQRINARMAEWWGLG